MPPRLAPRCSPALPVHPSASSGAIWVTDDLLSRAFQRYFDVSRARKRAVSSVPGPMYYRNRFGRRKITELNSFKSVGSMPIWALPDAPDFSKWQWQPPKPELWSQSLEAALGSLEPPGPPATATAIVPQAPKETEPIRIELSPQPWHSLIMELRTMHKEGLGAAEKYRTKFKTFVRKLKKLISKGKLSGSATGEVYISAWEHLVVARRVHPELEPLFTLLMSAVVRGIRSAAEVDRSFCVPKQRFWEVLLQHLPRLGASEEAIQLSPIIMGEVRIRHTRTEVELMLSALSPIFETWKTAEVHGEPEEWDWTEIKCASRLAAMWSGRLGQMISGIEADLANGQVEKAAFHLKVAKRCSNRVYGFILRTAHLMSNDRQVTKALGSALKNVDPDYNRVLLIQATKLLGDSETHWTRAHYNWLRVLAQLPKIWNSQFKKLLSLFPRRGHAGMSQTEICELLLLQWQSQGMLKDKGWTQRLWNNIQSKDKHIHFAALALAVHRTTNKTDCTAVFWDLWHTFEVKSGKKTLVKQLSTLSRHTSLSSIFLQRMAWTSNDHRVALLLHDVLVKQTGKFQHFWWPSFWDKFATLMKKRWKYPLIDPLDMAYKLIGPRMEFRPHLPLPPSVNTKIEMHDYFEDLQKTEKEPLVIKSARYNLKTLGDKTDLESTRQIARVKSVLLLVDNACQVTERQALRNVAFFTHVLARKQGALSARDLATLTSVIMQPFDKGKFGTTRVLKWFLGYIYQNLGEDTCVKVGQILKKRREYNEMWKKHLRRTVAQKQQEQDFAETLKKFEGQCQKHSKHIQPLWKTWVGVNRWSQKRRDKAARLARLQQWNATCVPIQGEERSGENPGIGSKSKVPDLSSGIPGLRTDGRRQLRDDQTASTRPSKESRGTKKQAHGEASDANNDPFGSRFGHAHEDKTKTQMSKTSSF